MEIRLGLISAYSLLYGVHKPETLLDRALSMGVKTVSVCDINNLYGVHSFLEAAHERGMRPLIGAALTAGESTGPAVYCFAENRKGFGRLCEILTERNRDIKTFSPLLPLREDSGGLVLASSDREILQNLAGQVKHLYAAITPDDLGGAGMCRKLSLPLAFLDTSLFLDRSDYAVHRTLRAIGLNKTTGSLGPKDTIPEGRGILKTSRELQSRLDSWPEAVKGSAEIAELCQFSTLFNGLIFPSYG